MNIASMQREFKFRMDKLDGLNYPGFEPEEIDLILNQAQQRIVKQRYGPNNFLRESFEETQKRTEDLRTLIRDITIQPYLTLLENVTTNSVFVPLPTDHWFIVQEKVVISGPKCNDVTFNFNAPGRCYPDPTNESSQICKPPSTIQVNGKWTRVKPTQHNKLDIILDDAFSKPGYDKVLRLMYLDRVELIPSPDTNVVLYKVRYIKKPLDMSLANSVDCELPDSIQDELVDEAVKIALEGIEAKRNNTYTQIVDNSKE